MSASEFAVVAARVAAGTASAQDRAAYAREIVGQAAIDGYSLATRRELGGRS